MVTGIIEEVGKIAEIRNNGDFQVLRLQAQSTLQDIKVGSSIAVNGVCLTVRTFDHSGFTADLSQETLSRTSLQNLRAGSLVNLERPMRADGRFGGHMVQGHVDGLGKIQHFSRAGDSWNLQIEFPPAALRY